MSKKIAFLTTIFPIKVEYLYDFCDSLQSQTYKDFDIVVLNDGYKDFDKLKMKYKELSFIELKYSNTLAKNREYAINYVIDNNYDILIFGDSDDYFSHNRVEKSIELLNHYDIVVNDLSLFREEGIYCQKYISNRINNNVKIDFEFIKDKNIFGLSNTALNMYILDRVVFNQDLVAVDWFLFKKLLKNNNSAIFTNETETFYRQYESNTLGLDIANNAYPLWWEDANTIKSKV